jgi:flagellar motor switch protein FliM
VSGAEIIPVSLLKASDDDGGFAEIEVVGERIARGVQELLTASSGHIFSVKPGSVNAASYAEWRIAQNPYGMLFRYRLTAQNGQMLVHIPGILLSQIVDLAYGGSGNPAVRSAFTPAEMRFAKRIAEALIPAIRTAWNGPPSVMPSLENIEPDLLNARWAKSQDRILTNSVSVEADGITPATICWIISVDTAKAAPTTGTGSEPTAPDPVWSQRMKASAMGVRLPARSVLTRCELPLTRLLHLSPGDVIPIFLPSTIPLTVAGRAFAHGSIGEANGRAAIRIETMEKGFDL